MTLPALGQCEYNEVKFSALNRSHISGTPVPGPDGRSMSHIEWNLEVEGYVVPADGGADEEDTEKALTNMRKKLTTPAGILHYSSKGFGDLNINELGVYDVAYGPWPRLLSWKPIGDKQAAFVTWACKVSIPEGQTVSYVNEIMSCSYTVDFDIDQDGYSTVTYSGSIILPATRIRPGADGLGVSADNYRDKVKPPVLVGFQRTWRWGLSPDKRTLSFTITDREIPRPLPDGVTTCDIIHRVGSKLDKNGFVVWNGSIAGSIIMGDGLPKGYAWLRFTAIVNKYLGLRRSALVGKTGKGKTIFIDSLEMSDEIFGRRSAFNLTYRILGTSLRDVFKDTNIFAPFSDSFQKWQGSLANSSFHNRGDARLGFNTNDDRIIELTGNKEPLIKVSVIAGKEADVAKPVDDGAGVDPRTSWLSWRCNVILDENVRKALHKKLVDVNLAYQPGVNAMGFWEVMATIAKGGGANPATGSGVSDVVQQVTTPTYRVWLVGYAKRLQYPVAIPGIVAEGGVVFEPGRRQVQQGQPTSLGGIPVYEAHWVIEYIAKRAPKEIPVPSNPLVEQNSN